MSLGTTIRSQIAPIHPQGYPFVATTALLSAILFVAWSPLGWIGVILTLWCAYFFGEPARVTPLREGSIVAPAGGRVSRITYASPLTDPRLSERSPPRISVFMSVFACHVNRTRMAG